MRRETGAQAATAAPRWPRAEFLSVYDRTAWFGPPFGHAVVAREYAVNCWGIRRSARHPHRARWRVASFDSVQPSGSGLSLKPLLIKDASHPMVGLITLGEGGFAVPRHAKSPPTPF